VNFNAPVCDLTSGETRLHGKASMRSEPGGSARVKRAGMLVVVAILGSQRAAAM